LLDALQHSAFAYFVQVANPDNGLIADTTRAGAPASIAAVGFALSVVLGDVANYDKLSEHIAVLGNVLVRPVLVLGRHTHRVAISNNRLVNLEDGVVRFRWTDDAHGHRVKTMALPAAEFLVRFLLHVLPDGLVRIRHFGLLANRGRTTKLARCRALLAAPSPPVAAAPETVAALMLRVTGVDIMRCPVCRQGRLRRVGVLPPGALPVPVWDTS